MTESTNKSTLSPVHPFFIAAAVFCVAVTVRLVYLNQIAHMPTFNYPDMDEAYHVFLAKFINSTGGLGKEPFFRAPLYPYLLAVLLKVTHNSLYMTRFIQVIYGSFIPVLIYFLGLKLLGRRLSYWTGGIAAIYPTFVYYDSTFLITSLMILFTLILVLQLYRCQENPSYSSFVLAGIILGLAGLTRPNILLFGPALFVWVWLVIRPAIGWKKALVRYSLMGLVCLFTILPVSIRNYVVSKDMVFISWQGGFNFYLGNNRDASGWSATAPGIDKRWKEGFLQSIRIAESAAGRKLKKSEVSDYWYKRTWGEIKKDPQNFFALLLKKFRLVFLGYEIPNNQNLYVVREFAPLMKPLMFTGVLKFPYGLLAPLAIMGLIVSAPFWRKFLLIYLLLSSYIYSLLLFFVCARFRQPLVPFLILFAVFGVQRCLVYISERKWIITGLFLFCFCLLIVESNRNALGLETNYVKAEDHLLIGNAYIEQGALSRAEAEFRMAIAADSSFAAAYHNLGYIYGLRGDWPRAIDSYRSALRINPTLRDTYLILAEIYKNSGNISGSIEILEKARMFHLADATVHFKLGMAYIQTSRLEDAKREMEQSLRLNPANTSARKVLKEIIRKLKKN